MSKYNWNSTGPGGCDSHNIEHPCGKCITGINAPRLPADPPPGMRELIEEQSGRDSEIVNDLNKVNGW